MNNDDCYKSTEKDWQVATPEDLENQRDEFVKEFEEYCNSVIRGERTINMLFRFWVENRFRYEDSYKHASIINLMFHNTHIEFIHNCT